MWKVINEESDDDNTLAAEVGSETDHISESDHNTDTDEEEPETVEFDDDGDEESDSSSSSQSKLYLGKDGTRWLKKVTPKNVCTRSPNIISHLPGPKGQTKSATTPLAAWNCMISDNIIY
ncbi:hypothetical protein QE152_g37956 [Popillia japonica]|uniref:Uncharacterized protein n=1 Tax=Popillia japonica TaxID=7064 RepID=A0AAW1I8M9_POPJA